MDFRGEVFSDPCDKGYFAVFGLAQHHHPGAQLLAQAVHELPNAVPVQSFDLADQHFGALDGLGFCGQFIQLIERAFAALIGELFFKLARSLGQLFNCRENGVFAHVELFGDGREHAGLVLKMFQCADAGNRFNAAYACRYGLFAHDFDYTDVADALHVRAAAQFLRVEAAGCSRIGNGHHANIVLGIFVAEESQSSGSQCFIEGSHIRF